MSEISRLVETSGSFGVLDAVPYTNKKMHFLDLRSARL